MNVLFYSSLPTARHGGVARWLSQMAPALRAQGNRVRILAWGWEPPDPNRWGPDLHYLPLPRWLQHVPSLRFWVPLCLAARAGRRLLEEVDVQVIQTVGVYETFSAALARGSAPAALVLSLHGDYVAEMGGRWRSRLRRRLYLPLEHIAFRQCQAVTMTSAWLESRLAPHLGRVRTAVIQPAVEPPAEVASPVGRSALGLPEDRPIVLTLNNLWAPYRRAGLDLLVAAAPAIVAQVPHVLFVVAGGVNDPARDERSLAWARSVAAGLPFLFTGYRARPPTDLMAAADLYAHVSYLDNSPMSLMEAMILGKPVVATRVGGIPELVEHGETGLLVPLEAPALAEAVASLLRDRSLAQAMGERARGHACQAFCWARAGEQLTALYQQLVGRERDAAVRLRPAEGDKRQDDDG